MSGAPVYLSVSEDGARLFNVDYITVMEANEKRLHVRFTFGGSFKFYPGTDTLVSPGVLLHDLVEAIARAKANGGGVLELRKGRFEIAKVARAASVGNA